MLAVTENSSAGDVNAAAGFSTTAARLLMITRAVGLDCMEASGEAHRTPRGGTTPACVPFWKHAFTHTAFLQEK